MTRYQQRLSNLIGPYQGTYGIAYRVLQPLLVWHMHQETLVDLRGHRMDLSTKFVERRFLWPLTLVDLAFGPRFNGPCCVRFVGWRRKPDARSHDPRSN